MTQQQDSLRKSEEEPKSRCQYRAGWCEKPAGHGDDHYTTYRDGEQWIEVVTVERLIAFAMLVTEDVSAMWSSDNPREYVRQLAQRYLAEDVSESDDATV